MGIVKSIRQHLCGLTGHRKYTVNPTDYIGWAEEEHEGEVPIWICEECGKSKWVDEKHVK